MVLLSIWQIIAFIGSVRGIKTFVFDSLLLIFVIDTYLDVIERAGYDGVNRKTVKKGHLVIQDKLDSSHLVPSYYYINLFYLR